MDNNIRQKILKLLEDHHRLTVTEILIHLRLLQSITSQHLSILRRARMVCTMRVGKNIYYELNPEQLANIRDFTKALLIM